MQNKQIRTFSAGLGMALLLTASQLPGAESPTRAIPGTPGWDCKFDTLRALRHVRVLASDSLAGRYSGFAGWDKVERYLAGHFKRLGLMEPFGRDGYLHRFTYGAGEYSLPSHLVAYFADGSTDTASYWQELNVFKYSGFGRAKGRIAFVGYGISEPGKGWDDYAGLDVTGCVVLAMRGTPEVRNVAWGPEGGNGYKSTLALSKGAVGYICCENDPPKYATLMEESFRENLPAVWISRTFADSLLKGTGKTKSQWQDAIKSTGKPVSRMLDVEVDLQVSGKYYPERPTTNIAGILEGSDPVLKRELVVIGAHADHHGTDPAGNIYPGADDNASGTSVMMELAEIFSRMKDRPRRSLMFIGFAAEEEGLVGSDKFCQDLPLKDYDVVAMLNMDMVGQGSGEIGVGGLGQTPVLGEALFAEWPDSALAKIEFWGLWPGSDHKSFEAAGIPAFIVGARGDHPNYHTPNDKAENIKGFVLKNAGEMMFHCARSLANWNEPLKPLVGKAQYLARKNPKVITEGIALEGLIWTGNDSYDREARGLVSSSLEPPPNRVKGVKYPASLVVFGMSWPQPAENRHEVRAGGYMEGLEFARLWSASQDLPFLADSGRKDYTGEPFLGVTASIGISDVPSDTLTLRALSRAGVGFVSAGGFVIPKGGKSNAFYPPDWAEVTAACRATGIRATIAVQTWASDPQFADPNATMQELAALARLWDGEIIVYLLTDKPMPDEGLNALLKEGCFLFLNQHSSLETAQKSGYFNQIGIAIQHRFADHGDSARIRLIESLLAAGFDEDAIEDLLTRNLQRTLQRWWAGSPPLRYKEK